MKTETISPRCSLCLALLCASLSVARATTVTNADTGGSLTVGSSWFGGVAPSTTSVGVWDTNITTTTPGNATSVLGGAASWQGIQILNPAEPIVISSDGNTLTLGASGIDMSLATNTLTLNCAVSLGANQAWNVTNGQTLTIGGAVSGSGILTLNGSGNTNGTVVLSVANSYSGGTVINGGIVVPATITSFGAGASSAVTNYGGTILLSTFPNSGVMVNPFAVEGTMVIDLDSRGANSYVLDGEFLGGGTIYVTNYITSGATLTFGGNGDNTNGTANNGNMNNFTGSIIVVTNASGTASAGTIRFNNGGGSYNLGNPLMTLNLGSGSVQFTEKNSGTTTSFGALYGGPSTALAKSENYVIGGLNITNAFGGTILSSSSLTKTGSGILILTNVSSYTGSTTVSSGALQIGDGNADGGLSGTSGVSVSSGASLIFNRPDSYTTAFNISGAGATIVTGGGTNNYSGKNSASGVTIITNNCDLLLTGTGGLSSPVFLAANCTFDVSALGSGFNLAQTVSGSGTVTNSVALNASSGSGLSPGNGVGAAGTLTIDSGLTESGGVNHQFYLSSPGGTNDLIAVLGPLTVSGANNITLSDFRGGTIPYGIYPLITYTGAFTGATNNFTVSAVGVTGTVTNITTVTPNEIAVIITPPFRSALNLTWVGDGVNNYWDTVSSGDWKNGAAFYTFQAGDSVLFTDSGAPNTNVLLQAAVLPAAVVVSNSTAELYTFTDNGTGLGNLSGATGLTKTNTGTLTILNSNTYTGITLVEEGALEVTNVVNGGLASAIGAATSDPSNLVFYASTFRFSGLVSAAMDRGMSNLGGETVDVTNATTTLTENGVVAGTGPLTKVGLGTLTLANANTYAGGTVLSNGILAAANQTANASGFGPTTSPISFYGGTLALYRNNGDDGSTTFSFSNPLIVPAGQTGVLDVFERGTLSSALTGGGTLNVSSAGARAAFSGNWSAFTGTVNITGTFRIANTFGYSNAVLNLSGGADLDGGTATGTYSSSPTFEVGELDATNLTTAATLGATSKPTPSPTWRVGWKNTTSTFDGTIENPSGGVASIIKVGAGAWLLGGQNTYTGSTTISNGTLALTNMTGSDGSIADTTNIFINSGAVLDVSAISTGALALNSGQTLSGAGTLNGSLSAASGTTLSPGVAGATGTFTINNSLTENGGVNHLFALSTGANPDLINVLGALNVSGFNNITLSEFGGGQIAPGTYPLISYPPGGLSGDISSFNLVDGGTVFFSGVLTNITTVTPNLIAVVILPLPPATNVTWVGDGVNNYWDYLTTNWAAGSTPMSFEPGDTVLFTDSGSASPPVNLTTTLYPAAVVVSNSTAEPYTFTDNGTGLGILGGSTSLTKTNTGTLTILNSNAYAGQTILGEGVMEVTNVNNSLEPSPLGAANNDPSNLVFYAGTLRYSGASAATDHGITSLGEATVDVTNASTTLTNNGPVAGAGGLIKVGLGTLSLGSAGNYTGGTIISNGVLALGSQNANNNGSGRGALGFATNPVSFMGGTLQLYGYGLSNTNDYNIFNNPLVVPTNQTGTLLMFPRTASSPGMLSSLTGGGTLTVVANFVRSWMGGNWSAFTGLIIVTNLNSGAAANVADSFEIDNSYGYSNATFWLQGAAVMDYALGANATIKIGALTGDPGTVLGSGNDTQPNPNYSVGWLNTTNLFAGAILDPTTNNGPFPGISTSITKVGSGSWYLGGTNTYTGSTTISNGTLGLTNVLGLANGGGDASIGASTNIFINSGAFLDVSGISSASLVLSNAQTLTGGGTILGALDTTLGGTGAGGTVSPGAAPSATGALTVTNNITLGGNVVMKLNYPASDKLVALGAGGITYGGTLTVTNIGGAIPVGAVFTLFSAPAFNASHFSGGTLPSSDYYSWDLSQLAVNGTIRVSAVAQPGISSANFSGLAGGSITLNATNGVPGGLVEILSTTNIALPFANWIPVLTNNFDLNGNLDIVITANPLTSQEYYILQAF